MKKPSKNKDKKCVFKGNKNITVDFTFLVNNFFGYIWLGTSF